MNSAREEWKELRPRIGSFISKLDALYKGADGIDETIANAEERGYKRGFEQAKMDWCKDCDKSKWFTSCNGNFTTITQYLELNEYDKQTVRRVIESLRGGKNE